MCKDSHGVLPFPEFISLAPMKIYEGMAFLEKSMLVDTLFFRINAPSSGLPKYRTCGKTYAWEVQQITSRTSSVGAPIYVVTHIYHRDDGCFDRPEACRCNQEADLQNSKNV